MAYSRRELRLFRYQTQTDVQILQEVRPSTPVIFKKSTTRPAIGLPIRPFPTRHEGTRTRIISWEREPFHISSSLLLLVSHHSIPIRPYARCWQVGKDVWAEHRVGYEAEALLPVCPYVQWSMLS